MIFKSKTQERHHERGSALVYILIAIALLAALTVTFMEPSSQQTSSQNTFKTVNALQGQADLIRSAIQECVLSYPRGDSSIASSGDDPGARDNYPIKPNSTHFNGATIGPTPDRLARDIRCPGNPGVDNNHERIFGGRTGKFLGPPPDMFKDWKYYNGPDGVFFWIETDKTDAFIRTALERMDEKFAQCEAEVITGGASGVNMDSGSPAQTQCPANHMCFLVRMFANSSAIYTEAGCS